MPKKLRKGKENESVQYLLRLPIEVAMLISQRSKERDQYAKHVISDLLREIIDLKNKYGENVEMGMFERIKQGGI